MRIVAGEYGGRKLKTLDSRVTRPTTDKVRAAIFNMIGPYFDGERVLDLYAGTGALAIEAVSRGCAAATLVEKDRAAQEIILANIAMTKEEEKFQVLKMPAHKALSALTGQFDLVFLDPPYVQAQMEKDISQLLAHELLADRAFIICETEKNTALPDNVGRLQLAKEKIYGITKINIYR